MESANLHLIAPCGINCRVCRAYMRSKKPCLGCNSKTGETYKHIVSCKIKNCPSLLESASGFCYSCEKIPCQRLKQLNKRYSLKYHTKIFENQENIKELGVEKFYKADLEKWTCPSCHHLICMHTGLCENCGKSFQ